MAKLAMAGNGLGPIPFASLNVGGGVPHSDHSVAASALPDAGGAVHAIVRAAEDDSVA
mgnify:CR=1 FL=1